MRRSSCIQVSLTLILLLVFAQISSASAASTSYRGTKSMQKSIDSKQILHEISDELRRMMHDNRRVMANTHREAPEGPDPQHHV